MTYLCDVIIADIQIDQWKQLWQAYQEKKKKKKKKKQF